ncbi:MAG TPA: ABC transporter permease [Micropepsaceae bacterium]|nr:ABC transporter permease [Micropepsaceae bacterium]
MNAILLAIAQLRHQKLQTALQILLLALGTAAMALMILLGRGLERSIERDLADIDLVVGAKGSPLQLILSAVYQIDVPTGNISREEASRLAADPRIALAVPLALGDSFRGARIVGTTPDYVALYGGTLSEGAMFSAPLEAVIGSEVARATGLRPGGTFTGAHGLTEGGGAHEDHPYMVTGVLAPTGTVLDRLVITSLESVWEVHKGHDAPGGYDPSREVTALLIRYKTPIAGLQLPRFINDQTSMQAAAPATEVARLYGFLGVGRTAFQMMGLAFIALAALSVFAGLYATLDQRRHDLAIMRALGATRTRIFGQVLGEAALIGLGGAALGLLVAHLAATALAAGLGLGPMLPEGGNVFYGEEFLVALLALASAAAAAILPALNAYRMDIAVTLQRA